MKKAQLLIAALALLTLVFGVANATATKSEKTLSGEYNWNNGTTGPIEARFTADGDNSWKVAFHFEFDGKDNVWKGTAEGSLEQGELNGVVKHRGRTFVFRGDVQKGSFTGTHAEIRSEGEERATGTMTLS